MLDTPTKALLSGAAVAVILAAGVYLAKEIRSANDRAAATETADAAKQELVKLADESFGETAAIKKFCEMADTASSMEGESQENWKRLARNCRALGYL